MHAYESPEPPARTHWEARFPSIFTLTVAADVAGSRRARAMKLAFQKHARSHPETGTINPRAHSTQHRPPWHTPHPYPIHTPVAALSSAPHLVPSQNYTSSNNNLPSNDAHRSRWSGCGSQLWLSSTSFARAAAYPLPGIVSL